MMPPVTVVSTDSYCGHQREGSLCGYCLSTQARGCRGPGGMQEALKCVLVDGDSGKAKGHTGNAGLHPSIPFTSALVVTSEQPCP